MVFLVSVCYSFIVIQIAAVGTLREMYFNAFVTQRVIEEKKMGEGLWKIWKKLVINRGGIFPKWGEVNFQPLTTIAKRSILDVLQKPEYVPAFPDIY